MRHFFAKVLDNLIPFDEEDKVGLIKNKISDGEENIKKEISMTESTNKKIKIKNLQNHQGHQDILHLMQ